MAIGGGFYGAAIAIYQAKQRGFKNIVLIERDTALLTRASYDNQARVHNGYHYPRSFTTAYRSRINQPKFVHDWPSAVNPRAKCPPRSAVSRETYLCCRCYSGLASVDTTPSETCREKPPGSTVKNYAAPG